MRILLVEDDESIAAGLVEAFRRRFDAVDVLHAAEPAVPALACTHYDLAIVDIGLPGMDGFELVRRARQRKIHVPVLVLTARDAVEDRVHALNLGADDYLRKPFSLDELLARSQALVRRSRSATTSVVHCGRLELDLAAKQATLGGAPLDLTAREWVLLEQLSLAAPTVVSKERLADALGRWDREVTPNAVEVCMSRLRAKLAGAGVELRTMRGLGYRMLDAGPGPVGDA